MAASHVRSSLLCALTVALVIAGRLAADGREPAEAAGAARATELRARGLELGYNLDHADALDAFRQAIAADPLDPTAYRLAAATAWIALLFEQGAISIDDYLGQARATLPRQSPNPALAAAFRRDLERALTLSEQRLRERPTDADAHYQAGAAFGFLASYTATIDGRVLASLGSARRAYQEHQRVLELDPSRKDAGLIVGMYRYAVSYLSPPLRLFARLAGFGGDRRRGLRMVEEAAGYPSVVQPNALFTLVLMYNREARYDDALRVIGELQRRFPKNRLLWLEAASTALRAGRAAEAKAALDEGLLQLARDPRPRAFGEVSRWQYAYGATLVALRDLDAAARALNVALAGATRDWVRGRAHKELGKLADLRGLRAHACAEYRLADRLCRSDHDADCSAETNALLRTPYR